MGSRLSATTLPMLPTRLQERDADRLYAMRDLVMPKSGPKVMAAMTARTKVGFSHNCMASLSMSILHSRSCRSAAGNYREPRIERTSAVRGLSRPCRSVDLRSEADKLIELICELFPICRSITGDDLRQSLFRLGPERYLASTNSMCLVQKFPPLLMLTTPRAYRPCTPIRIPVFMR